MRLHVLSDLHNEFGKPFQPLVRDADVTILAGDIDIKGRALKWARASFEGDVIYVAGNHDLWGGHLDNAVEKMREAAPDGIYILERDEIVLGGVRFLGATAWTDYRISGNPALAMEDAAIQMIDFKKIRWAPEYRRLKPEVLAHRAQETYDWLSAELAKPFDGKTVVVTHHAPSSMSLKSPDMERTSLDASFANNWSDLFGGPVMLWVHGHTHHAVDYVQNGTRVVSNPRGYPGEVETGFRADFTLFL